MQPDPGVTHDYMEAYERWQRDIERLHKVFVEGEPLDPMHRVALLRSESHTHDRYEEARRKLLGLPDESESSNSPFGSEGG